MSNTGSVEVKSVSRAFAIVSALQELDGASLREVSNYTDLPQSTAYDYLSSLEALGYVTRVGGAYEPGLKFLDHGMYARNNQQLVQKGASALETLAEETKEATWLVTEDQGMAVVLDRQMGENAVPTLARVGSYRHLHYMASGRAILAHLPKERVREIIERHGLPSRTEASITDSEELFAELEAIRDRGYAVNTNDATKGVRAVGGPIFHEGSVVGAISVSGPGERVNDPRLDEDVVSPLRSAINEIELKLGTEIE
ncbi:IclR family transcriptional regulator domain-containing protein [Halobellus sp. GM3]|uniref:IclR family transcriptional regulator domain-containing protein n=1 Tax=Halobellus sp. GM3 TaxID=3458410 RepID=UPI00403DA377